MRRIPPEFADAATIEQLFLCLLPRAIPSLPKYRFVGCRFFATRNFAAWDTPLAQRRRNCVSATRERRADGIRMAYTLPADDIYQVWLRKPIDMAAPSPARPRFLEDAPFVTFERLRPPINLTTAPLFTWITKLTSPWLSPKCAKSRPAHEKYRIHRVACVHRLGASKFGETSVFIAYQAAPATGPPL